MFSVGDCRCRQKIDVECSRCPEYLQNHTNQNLPGVILSQSPWMYGISDIYRFNIGYSMLYPIWDLRPYQNILEHYPQWGIECCAERCTITGSGFRAQGHSSYAPARLELPLGVTCENVKLSAGFAVLSRRMKNCSRVVVGRFNRIPFSDSSFSRLMNVLVTGGAGYIGAHAVKQLLAAGYNPVVLDNLSNGHRQTVPELIPFYQTDLAETDKITEILQKHEIGVVMHFAALIAVGESVEKPLLYYRNNTAGAISLLEAMDAAGVKKFIFSSTAATYGEPEETPIFETSRQLPINPYGRSKWYVEQILKDKLAADPAFGLTIFRYFNVAGAAKDGSLGEDHEPETHLIPLVLFAALGKQDAITVFGTDYPTPDGTCIRDYVHVEDLVDAHILAIGTTMPGDGQCYNLGIGRGYSVREILDAAKKVTGCGIPTKYGVRRDGDPAKLYANADKARKELGWKPKYTEPEEIIETAWKWTQKMKNEGKGSRHRIC